MSKGLEAFKDIIKIYGETNSLEGTYNSFLRIKKELKAIEIFKKTLVVFKQGDYLMSFKDHFEEYEITKEEFELLKEVLE